MSVTHRVVMAALLGVLPTLLVACVSPEPRPVLELGETQEQARKRIGLTDDKPGTPILTVLALGGGDGGLFGTETAETKAEADAAGAAEEAGEAQGADRPGAAPVRPRDVITLDEVLRSVELQFPAVLAALETIEIAAAEETQALGGFDARFKGGAAVGAQGFYENEQAGAYLEQPTTAGGLTFFGGYKRGTGSFPIWEGGDKTNSDGEVSFGVRLPLLRGRAIDQRRLDLWRARLAQDAAEPVVLSKRLEATQKASLVYWKWVSAGQKRTIARRLLDLARNRQQQVDQSVDLGKLAELDRTDNRRLVVEREALFVQAERALESAAIALSLFWRDPSGAAVVPSPDQLPEALPEPTDPELTLRDDDVEFGLRERPELRAIEIDLERVKLDRRKAVNDMLPKVDVAVAASQDYGDASSDPDDKGPFEFDAFLTVDVPVQRRNARGKRDALDAKARKLRYEQQLAKDQVTVQIEDARSAVRRSWQQLARIRENVELAARVEQAERELFVEGKSDLFRVNIREQQTASAASKLVETVTRHYQSIAVYRASLGVQ